MATGLPAATTIIPGRKPANQLVSRVLSFLQEVQSDPELDQLALDGLNSGIALINGQEWKKFHGYQDITTVQGTVDYSLDDNFKDPITLDLLDASGNPDGFLEYKPYHRFMRMFPISTTESWPSHYTIFYDEQRLLTLNYQPQASFVSQYPTMRLRFHRREPELVGAAATTLTPEFDWFLIWHARAELAADRNPDKYRIAKSEAERRFRQLQIDDQNVTTDYPRFR